MAAISRIGANARSPESGERSTGEIEELKVAVWNPEPLGAKGHIRSQAGSGLLTCTDHN